MQTPFFLREPGAATGAATDPATDNTKLITTETVYVSDDGGTTNVAFPEPGKEYDFCVAVTNAASVASGPFLVRFGLDDGNGNVRNFDFNQDAGLDANQSLLAVAHFGQFTNDDTNYTLSACIYSPSAPEKPINCAGTFGFNPHQNSSSTSSDDSGSGNSPVTDDGSVDPTDTTSSPDADAGTTDTDA